jgi:hypothetical protein
MSLCDYEELKRRYAGGYATPKVEPTNRMEWPRPLSREDVDPLLRAVLRAEAERKATAATFSKGMGRIIRRTLKGSR